MNIYYIWGMKRIIGGLHKPPSSGISDVAYSKKSGGVIYRVHIIWGVYIWIPSSVYNEYRPERSQLFFVGSADFISKGL